MTLVSKPTFEIITRVSSNNSLERLTELSVGIVTDQRWVSHFEPAGIAAILRSHGLCAIEDINFQEIKSRFVRSV